MSPGLLRRLSDEALRARRDRQLSRRDTGDRRNLHSLGTPPGHPFRRSNNPENNVAFPGAVDSNSPPAEGRKP
jgi:hypothetical protein